MVCEKNVINIRHGTASHRIGWTIRHGHSSFTILVRSSTASPMASAFTLAKLRTQLPFVIFQLPEKLLLNWFWPVNCIVLPWSCYPSHSCQSPMTSTFRGVVNLRPLLFGALRYVAHIILLLSIKRIHLITRFYGIVVPLTPPRDYQWLNQCSVDRFIHGCHWWGYI